MDPALQELAEAGDAEDEVAILIRLRDPVSAPERVRLVARFGDVATARLRRGDIRAVHADARTLSLKAPQPLSHDTEQSAAEEPAASDTDFATPRPTDERRPDVTAEGRGVVIGFLDWGVDFTHPDFRKADGSTRLLALWDQRRVAGAPGLEPYGYGRAFLADAIDRALATADPFGALRYRPSDFDAGLGAHGTHTLGIAAGNGRGGGPLGMAPAADLVFVNLALEAGPETLPLSSSADLLEALDFITTVAAGRPCVVNMSLGRHAGEHTGHSLTELALEQWVAIPGRAAILSCGNYYARGTHASWLLRPGLSEDVVLEVDPEDPTPNEIDIWYPGSDRVIVELRAAAPGLEARVKQGEHAEIKLGSRTLATVRHRAHDPNNGDHQCTIWLVPERSMTRWMLTLRADDVVDGRVHAWIERDAGCAHCQLKFPASVVDTRYTLGTICGGLRTIAVGAFDAHHPSGERPETRFTSSGPTRDGRQKPDLLAPGQLVLAARSASPDQSQGLYTRMSGTSMAAPHVTGTVALIYEAAGRALPVHDLRALLHASCDPPRPGADPLRVGSGYLNAERALRALAGQPDSERSAADQETEVIVANQSPLGLDRLGPAAAPAPACERCAAAAPLAPQPQVWTAAAEAENEPVPALFRTGAGQGGETSSTNSSAGGSPGFTPLPNQSTGHCERLTHFGLDSTVLTASHHAQVTAVAQHILSAGLTEVHVLGFASTDGADSYNLGLGRRRAQAVGQALQAELERQQLGSSVGVRITIDSRGEREQIPGGPQMNRRADICFETTPVGARVCHLVAKSFIATIGSNIGTVCGGDPIRMQALALLARATDDAFSEAPIDDRVFVAPPPDNKGYRLFSSADVRISHRGSNLLGVALAGPITMDSGRECVPRSPVPLCMQAPPLVLELPFTTSRIDVSRMRFSWGVKGRPPSEAELAFGSVCPRTSVYIWHRVKGVVDCSSGSAVVTAIVEGSHFPSHAIWIDHAPGLRVPQGSYGNLWVSDSRDPTRVH